MAVNLRGVWNCMKHELRHMPASVDRIYGPTEAEKWRSLSPWTDGESVSGK